ncbi:MAG: mechanosensitive ion channel domain-containing protein [Bacteroidota bacterium]
METLQQFLETKFFEGTDFEFPLINIFYALLILTIARLILWVLIKILLPRYYKRRKVDRGSRFAVNQILRYFTYVIAILMALQALGIQLTVIWGGAAALAVGIGLGLQQTFNDFASGIILLFDRSIEVGDVIQIGTTIGKVEKIGMRTSQVWSRNNVMLIIPNSKMVVESVVNWSHNDKMARFSVQVGVAYGSDTAKVKELLLQAVNEHGQVLKKPTPFVRFQQFADSSLNFEVFFFSEDMLGIDDVQSDIRFRIDELFRENNVEIPFPQRDIHIKGKQE